MSHSMTAPQAATRGGANGFTSRYADHRVSFFGLLKSEFIKVTTLGSTYWLLGVALVLTVGMATLFSFLPNQMLDFNAFPSGPDVPSPSPAEIEAQKRQALEAAKAMAWGIPTAGLFFSILVFGSFSVIVIAGEYGTGMIRSTMAAAPKRWPALLAKTIVALLLGAIVGLVGMLASYGIGQLILKDELRFSLMDHNVFRTVLMGSLYVMFVVLMGFGVGLLLRNGAGGVVTVIAILFVLPIVVTIAGQIDWVKDVSRFIPSELGTTMMNHSDDTSAIREGGPQALRWNEAALWLGLEALVVWVAGLFVAQKRDV